MNINKKIAEIRLQPEHIRMQYVWGCVAISMLIIFSVWIFSISTMFGKQQEETSKNESSEKTITKQLQELKQQAPSIKDFNNQTTINSDQNSTQNTTISEFQYSSPAENISQAPQANAYSDLPLTTQGQ